LLVTQGVVSYRSIPRILELFNQQTSLTLGWVPHFTSVINWTLRLGLGLLKQVKPISKPWLAIIDHSIDIGTKKAFVVLRVTVETLSQKGKSIQLKDCECIGLTISEKVDGESIAEELKVIFSRSGKPAAIIKDCDSTLQKGVRLCSGKDEAIIPVIDDIGHVMASALKAQFEKTKAYKHFTACASQGAKRLRQTKLAFLTPPKLRSKGRFQSISKLGQWAEKMLDVLSDKGGGAAESDLLTKLRNALPGFRQLRAFIEQFARATKVVSDVMKILKTKGLDQETYEQCYQLAQTLPRNSKVRKRLRVWLQQHIEIQKQVTTLPLLVSSDIIESLFGSFKYIIARSPQADMNRTTLLIPALCGTIDGKTITQALKLASQENLKQWEKKNIPYTMRKKRQEFFATNPIQKAGKGCLA